MSVEVLNEAPVVGAQSAPNSAATDPSIKILDVLFYQLDINASSPTLVPFTLDGHKDLGTYLSGLVKEISEKDSKREFDFETTGVFKQAMASLAMTPRLDAASIGENLAIRLLEKEKNAEDAHGHLKGTREQLITKGSYLQITYQLYSATYYLGVKVEHQNFLDDIELKAKAGLSFENKLYKAVKLKITETPSDIYIYDTNSRISTYWWKDFLELKEKRSDSTNTKDACTWTIRTLNKIKKDHPADYSILRNATIACFKQETDFDYIEFIEKTFENYKSDDQELNNKLSTICSELKELPKKKGFDTHFKSDPKAVPFRKQKIALTEQIDLTLEEGIQDLGNKVWARKMENGKQCVVIHSPDGYEYFRKITHEE